MIESLCELTAVEQSASPSGRDIQVRLRITFGLRITFDHFRIRLPEFSDRK